MKKLVAIILFNIYAISLLHATVYYVKPAGSDAAAGTSLATAWATVQKAANTMVAGDICRVTNNLGAAYQYPETVTETTSGSAGNYIKYFAESTNVSVYNFNLSGANFVQVQGFEIKHPIITSPGYGIRATGTDCRIFDNFIHDTTQNNVEWSAAHRLWCCGNMLVLPCYTNNVYTGDPNYGSYLENGSASTNQLFEYTYMSNTVDYLNPEGGWIMYRHCMCGPSPTTFFGGTPHADVIQANVTATNIFIENMWHFLNAFDNAHFAIASFDGADYWTIRNNVSIASGDNNLLYPAPGDDWLMAHNTWCDVGTNRSGGEVINYNRSGNGPGDREISRNNLLTNSPSSGAGTVYEVQGGGGDITHDHDIAYPYFPDAGATDTIADPQFTDYAAFNLMPKATSPAVDTAFRLTATTSAGTSSSSITVTNARWFTDGMWGMFDGDKIYVGSANNLHVTGVNYATGVITVSESVTWSAGDAVGYSYAGSGPDKGALEYRAAGYAYSGVIAHNGTTHTVTITNPDVVRRVDWYVDGVFNSVSYVDSASTVQLTGTGGTVTAKLRPKFPTPVLFTSATENAGVTGNPVSRGKLQGIRLRP